METRTYTVPEFRELLNNIQDNAYITIDGRSEISVKSYVGCNGVFFDFTGVD